MTTYRLPDWLGDHEVQHYGAMVGNWPMVYFDNGECIALHPDHLTEVKPPLPPEPPNGTVYSNDAMAILRCDDPDIDDDEGRWYITGDNDYHRWAGGFGISDVVSSPGWRRYVPDPADDAPELPWTLDSCRRSASVGTPKHGTVVVDVPGIDYTPGELEQIARVLQAAARAAREVEKP